MRREQTLEEISDGKLYDSNDMVKADCHDCEGCCDCCQGMGDSVILDPYDVHRLSVGLKKPVEQHLRKPFYVMSLRERWIKRRERRLWNCCTAS